MLSNKKIGVYFLQNKQNDSSDCEITKIVENTVYNVIANSGIVIFTL